jgi:bacterioferritin (cytochrome b1)
MYLPPSKTYEYADDVARRLDIVHNGKFDLRNVDNEFLLAIGTMVSELLEVDMKDVKSVLNALRKGR